MRRDELLALTDAALLAQCVVDRLRGPGPGGQKRNKTESSVRLRHEPTGLSAKAGESRSQPENKARALRRLRERIALDLREPVDLDPYPVPPAVATLVYRQSSCEANEQNPRGVAQETVRKSEKWLRSEEYLRAVGHLLDLYQAVGCSVAEAAGRLGVSANRLDRILRADPRLIRRAGELRTAQRGRPVV